MKNKCEHPLFESAKDPLNPLYYRCVECGCICKLYAGGSPSGSKAQALMFSATALHGEKSHRKRKKGFFDFRRRTFIGDGT